MTQSDSPAHDDHLQQEQAVAVYVRRGRTPTLGFWVVLALLISFFGGALGAVLLGVLNLAALMNAALLTTVVVGIPVAGVITLVDALRERRRRGSRPRR